MMLVVWLSREECWIEWLSSVEHFDAGCGTTISRLPLALHLLPSSWSKDKLISDHQEVRLRNLKCCSQQMLMTNLPKNDNLLDHMIKIIIRMIIFQIISLMSEKFSRQVRVVGKREIFVLWWQAETGNCLKLDFQQKRLEGATKITLFCQNSGAQSH